MEDLLRFENATKKFRGKKTLKNILFCLEKLFLTMKL